MPHFDDSFVSDCALAESRHVISYSLDSDGAGGGSGTSKLYHRRRLRAPHYFMTYRSRSSLPCVVVKNVMRYSTISSPSTPNSSSLSSQTNLHGTASPSPNSPSSATPSQSATPLGGAPQTSGGGSGSGSTSGHKNSLKGTKLARRARSFKDDLFEKISLMRTPTNTLGRSHSPHSPRSKHASSKPPPTAEEVARSSQSLETHVKDISNALKHFRDVILKKKLEVLPGNGTVILETIASMFAVIQSYTLNENSTVLLSATQQVYQALGKLIKLCDEVMLSDESSECASLSDGNVREVVDLLEDAVRNLVTLAQQKLKEREENAFKYAPMGDLSLSGGLGGAGATTAIHNNHLMRPPVEAAGQRTSLPDINLTPKERDILEKTNSNPIRASHSTESILRDTSPPPKPPLPNSRSSNPPPLPPKRRSQHQQQQHQPHSNNISMNSDLDCSSDFSLMNYGVDHLSVRSRSPDENSSQCSLDSALNHSREEEEIKLLSCLEHRLHDNNNILLVDDATSFKSQVSDKGEFLHDDDVKKNNIANKTNMGCGGGDATDGSGVDRGSGSNSTATTTVVAGIQNVAAAMVLAAAAATPASASAAAGPAPAPADNGIGGAVNVAADKLEMRKITNNRHSNESGFVSMKSYRTSTQSVSKRSSDYSFQSSTKSSNSEIVYGTIETIESAELQAQQTTSSSSSSIEQHQHHPASSAVSAKIYATTSMTAMASTTSSSCLTGMMSVLGAPNSDDNRSISNTSSASPDQYEREKLLLSQLQSMSSLTKTNSLDISSSDDLMSTHALSAGDVLPPALPPKAQRCKERQHSFNDSFLVDDVVDNFNSFSAHDLPELRHHQVHQQQQHHQIYQWQSKHQSLIEPRRAGGMAGSCNAIGSIAGGDIHSMTDEPPPLPMKKKHILAYMEICSAPARSIEQHRHTVHAYNLGRNITHSQTMNIVPLTSTTTTSTTKEQTSPVRETPPALPPKNYKPRKPTATPPTIITTPPPSPKPTHLSGNVDIYGDCSGSRHGRVLSGTQGADLMSTVCEEMADLNEEEDLPLPSHQLPSEEASETNDSNKSPTQRRMAPISTPELTKEDEDEGIDVVLENHNCNSKMNCATTIGALSKDNMPNMLEEVEISPYLILKKENEDGPEVKGGYIDALIVHASRVQKISENAFSEAFITTFRTFIQPIDVIEKLTHRYTVFFCQLNDLKQKAAKETFSLLVRVVNDLTSTDLTSQLLTLLMEFDYQLVCSGQLYQVKLLRNKIIEKVTLYREQRLPSYHQSDMYFTVTNQPSLLDLKSLEIAEQMTLLDAELFQKIEIPEVLLFAKEQCEEKSPNLNKFTEHFNKMSYWARSKILMLTDAKEREKHVIKFIKIMKHLRKMNNYNSYLALLSALDSAPIRRLEWHKTITEGLKEYCTLIDSSSSFRVYRQALAETNPPCIPYIGLVLQDLTFVHVGNPDYLKEGVINFSKRWQQYNIIVNMKRFKKCSYPFRRNDRIIRFFENFENFLGEEEMWQISETIKPRGKRPTHN